MKLGFRDGVLYDKKRSNWDAAGPRPISWSLWYPAADDTRESEIPERSWFQKAAVARDAPIRPEAVPYPLVLLSHGTGGSAAGRSSPARARRRAPGPRAVAPTDRHRVRRRPR